MVLFLIQVLSCFYVLLNGQNNRELFDSLRTQEILVNLKGKKVGVICNYASLIQNTNIVDFLIAHGISVLRIFAPEHGFRQPFTAGVNFSDTVDASTGIPVISLYGTRKAPELKHISDLDILLFYLQDVGVRCYTFISTLYYVMDVCAEYNKELLVIDVPNPNGYFIDGPVVESSYRSFVGIIPVPLVYGMTIGEVAQMINQEGWLPSKKKCPLKVITLKNYNRCEPFPLKFPPSPGLPDSLSVWLYPHLVLLEGTIADIHRNTPLSFKCASLGDSIHYCLNYDSFLVINQKREIYLHPVIYLFNRYGGKNDFFKEFFSRLAGTNSLRIAIIRGESTDKIKKTWENNLKKFKELRKKYLLYLDCPWLKE